MPSASSPECACRSPSSGPPTTIRCRCLARRPASATPTGSPPEWRGGRPLLEADGDPWQINVVGHGLFGAEIYGRARRCGGSPLQAFVFAAGTSAVWEYGIESWNKRPSGVDLTLTPLLGAALGEARVQTQRWLRARPRGAWRRFVELVIDPLGEGERGLLRTRC